MEYDSFERDGTTIPTAEVQVRELVMLGSASRSGAGAGSEHEDDMVEDAGEAGEDGEAAGSGASGAATTGKKGGRRKAAVAATV